MDGRRVLTQGNVTGRFKLPFVGFRWTVRSLSNERTFSCAGTDLISNI